MSKHVTRRGFIAGSSLVLATGAAGLSARAAHAFLAQPQASDGAQNLTPGSKGTVTLYTSCDSFLLQPITRKFERSTGIKIKTVGDTEATKTTGLVERIVREKDKPVCDVWWSNETLGTSILASFGLFERFNPEALAEFAPVAPVTSAPKHTDSSHAPKTPAKDSAGPDEAGPHKIDPEQAKQEQEALDKARRAKWPYGMCDPDGLWYGTALRWRVLAYNINRIEVSEVPTSLDALVMDRFKGVLGMARPQFGTTRTQIAALVAMWGKERTHEWLSALMRNKVRLYDGNSAVVTALGQGEIEVGLTDTDDILQGKSRDLPIEFTSECGAGGAEYGGPLAFAHTVGLMKNRPHTAEGLALANYLLSASVEETLGSSEAQTYAIRPQLAAQIVTMSRPEKFANVSPAQIFAASKDADALIQEIIGVK